MKAGLGRGVSRQAGSAPHVSIAVKAKETVLYQRDRASQVKVVIIYFKFYVLRTKEVAQNHIVNNPLKWRVCL
jgi:hypothetical protein